MRVAVAIGLVGFLFSRIGLQPVVQSFSDVAWGWVVVAMAVRPLGLLLVTVRWRILLKDQGIRLSTLLLFKRFWIARFINNLLPGQTGGDLFRVFGSWSGTLNRTAVGSSVLMDRYTGLVGQLSLLSLIGAVEYETAKELNLGLVPIVSILVALILLWFLTMRRPLQWVGQVVAKWPGRGARSVAGDC